MSERKLEEIKERDEITQDFTVFTNIMYSANEWDFFPVVILVLESDLSTFLNLTLVREGYFALWTKQEGPHQTSEKSYLNRL